VAIGYVSPTKELSREFNQWLARGSPFLRKPSYKQKQIICFGFAMFVALSAANSNSFASQLLFASGFEGTVAVGKPYECSASSCFQDIFGTDGMTGHNWPPRIWSGHGSLQVLTDKRVTPDTASQYVINEIRTVTGHDGRPTRALYSELRKHGGPAQQDPYLLLPSAALRAQGDLYISYWIKLQPDLRERMGPDNWWVLFEWKTNIDHRLITYVYTDKLGKPYWYMQTDDISNPPSKNIWWVQNKSIAVPVGEWFKFEFFWHRSFANDGRAWQAVNGRVVFNRVGSLLGGGDPIDRIMVMQLYSGAVYPLYQWIDDIEIWDGFPCGDGTPCGTNSRTPVARDAK
jgi:hypothetical protein